MSGSERHDPETGNTGPPQWNPARGDSVGAEISPTSSIPSVLEGLADLILQRLCPDEGSSSTSVSIERIVERRFSFVLFLKLETDGGTRRLASKTTKHHDEIKYLTVRENQAAVEFDILQRLHTAFEGIENCFVPRPVLVIPERDTYVMDYVEGEVLSDLHRALRHFYARDKFLALSQQYIYCGKWLRHFQKTTGIRRAGAEAFSKVIERCDHRLRWIEETGGTSCPAGFSSRIKRFLDEMLSRIEDNSVPVCGRHSDFGPWNMIAGSKGLTVIDFVGYAEDPLAVDPLQILIHLEDEEAGLTISRRRVQVLRENFLSGYGTGLDPTSAAHMICESMLRLISMWGCLSHEPTHLHHRLESRVRFRRHMAWFMRNARQAQAGGKARV